MKALSRPISSPNRTDKFATPLVMRFLRSNAGSKSRGRSRSSPMFIVRSKKNAAAPPLNEVHQEPTSPKVTCIGQVRARRSSSKKPPSSAAAAVVASKRTAREPPQNSCCYCCCHGHDSKTFNLSRHFTSTFNKPRPNLRKWGRFFRFGYCKNVDTRDDSSKFETIQRPGRNQFGSTSSGIDIEDIEGFSKMIQESKQVAAESSTPPKNALLLTRCRSAPYRSSSLAVRFWGSPLGSSETEKLNTQVQEEETPAGKEMLIPEDVECEGVLSSPNCDELNEELDVKCKEKSEEENIQDFGRVYSVHPLLLTRCKSEPAKTGERLNPETNFWKQRRSDTAESCLQLSDLIS